MSPNENEDELDHAKILWYKKQWAIGAPLSGPSIKEKARIF